MPINVRSSQRLSILGLALIALVIFEYKTFIVIEIEILCRLKIESAYLLFHMKA